MEFQLSDEHQMIRQAARDFAVNECLPGVIERDEKQQYRKPAAAFLKILYWINVSHLYKQ